MVSYGESISIRSGGNGGLGGGGEDGNIGSAGRTLPADALSSTTQNVEGVAMLGQACLLPCVAPATPAPPSPSPSLADYDRTVVELATHDHDLLELVERRRAAGWPTTERLADGVPRRRTTAPPPSNPLPPIKNGARYLMAAHPVGLPHPPRAPRNAELAMHRLLHLPASDGITIRSSVWPTPWPTSGKKRPSVRAVSPPSTPGVPPRARRHPWGYPDLPVPATVFRVGEPHGSSGVKFRVECRSRHRNRTPHRRRTESMRSRRPRHRPRTKRSAAPITVMIAGVARPEPAM